MSAILEYHGVANFYRYIGKRGYVNSSVRWKYNYGGRVYIVVCTQRNSDWATPSYTTNKMHKNITSSIESVVNK